MVHTHTTHNSLDELPYFPFFSARASSLHLFSD